MLRDPGDPPRRVRAPGRPDRPGRPARAGDARVPVGLGAAADRLLAAVQPRGPRPPPPTPREHPPVTRSTSRPSTASRSPDHPGAGLDRRHRDPQAAEPAGHDEAEPDRQPDELSGRRQHARGARPRRQHPRRLRARWKRRGAVDRQGAGAGAFSSAITPGQWIQLIARLGEIPDPKVGSGPSAAAIPDDPGARHEPLDGPSTGAGEGR